MFSVLLETLGCRLNQTESESLAFIFAKYGFSVIKREDMEGGREKHAKLETKKIAKQLSMEHNGGCKRNYPRLCIVNTCTVTSKAEQKARRIIRLLLKTYEEAIVLVTGCYAELEAEKIEDMGERVVCFSGKKKDLLIHLPQYLKKHCEHASNAPSYEYEKARKNDLDLVAQLKHSLLSFKAEYANNADTLLQASCKPELLTLHSSSSPFPHSLQLQNAHFTPLFALSTIEFMFHSRATLKVQDGCNNACSFCRIRLARGKSVSLETREAMRRIKEIEEKGAAEVVITGVNLSQYKDDDKDFSHLLHLLLDATSHIRIRISSLYPESITPSFLSIVEDERICPHFHLSIQSGSNKILARMGRRYTQERVFEAVGDLRKVKKRPFIGCDIIAGFPEESEEDFLMTMEMCRILQLPGVHAFPFSPRPGTIAASMQGKVSERIAKERVSTLNAIAEKNYKAYLDSFDGKTLFAVVEGEGDAVHVTTENYLQLPLIRKENAQQGSLKAGNGLFVRIKGNEAEEV